MQLVWDVAESRVPLYFRTEQQMTDDEFYQFCQRNADLRIERTAEGEIIIMPGTGGITGYRNNHLSMQLMAWSLRDGRGVAFDSSTQFRLPSGASMMPDACWIERGRLAQLTAEEKRRFLPLCPDFVVELTSPSDRLPQVQKKMRQWMADGARIGWLIDADNRAAYIYRQGQDPERLVAPERLSGEGLVQGLVLELAEIWDPSL
ncbi:MAG: Uma2 family endonuclease [Candidatus Solibacter usitatus]|nr:Uma2 family endonuclease [Candidatus Solibacter usitatus]